jgi:hypothetical protein
VANISRTAHLAEVDLTAIMAALATAETEGHSGKSGADRGREAELERDLAAAKARIESLDSLSVVTKVVDYSISPTASLTNSLIKFRIFIFLVSLGRN